MAYIFKDNSKDKGGFTHIPSTRMNNRNSDDELFGAGAALIIGGLLGAAAVAAAIDDDIDTIDTDRVCREARRRVEAADRAARLGMSESEVIGKITKFAMKHRGRVTDQMVCTTAVVQKLAAQGVKFKGVVESEYTNELIIEGVDRNYDEIEVRLSWVGKLAVKCYNAKITKYEPHGKAFVNYECLVPDKCVRDFDAIVRVMSY